MLLSFMKYIYVACYYFSTRTFYPYSILIPIRIHPNILTIVGVNNSRETGSFLRQRCCVNPDPFDFCVNQVVHIMYQEQKPKRETSSVKYMSSDRQNNKLAVVAGLADASVARTAIPFCCCSRQSYSYFRQSQSCCLQRRRQRSRPCP